ncbi:NepR family anti-sigma factor [Thetidibacter halocola]|uniref:Anti-sigma factor NepR domain-containing protein n=1 Tax=Thetidibacter halocola TaxID=2827239 RepID=A0A8J7WE89_9RHOB|nr:NepR family anti-sigma factor [Thetidibacter halocola]MBS0123579.1 hypothetical protein [Thetidibacter halocola]
MTQDKHASRIEREIDANLRRVYQDVADEQVPDRFTDLLARLKAADSGKRGSNAE